MRRIRTITEKIIIFAIIMCLLVPAQVFAEEKVDTNTIVCGPVSLKAPIPQPKVTALEEKEGGFSTYALVPEYQGTETDLVMFLCDRIKQALTSGETQISLENEYRISYSQFNNIGCVQFLCPYLGEEIRMEFYYNPSTDLWTSMKVNTTLSESQIEKRILAVDRELEELFASTEGEMSEEDRALAIHDFICSHVCYDYETANESNISSIDPFSSYGLLINKTGVCSAYAYLYMYCMNQTGIKCMVNTSSSMNHAWNVAKINGNYYEIDCTWDDPLSGEYEAYYGGADHSYFLLSDEAFQNGENGRATHSDYAINTLCTDKTYDQYYWTEAISPIISYGDAVYYISQQGLVKREKTNSEKTIVDDLGIWNAWQQAGYWPGKFSGLFLYDGGLFYNTSTQINQYHFDTGEVETYMTPDVSNGYVYGILKEKDHISYAIRQSFYDEIMISTHPFQSDEEPNVPSVHAHNMKKNAEREATCTENGQIEYYQCLDCGKYYRDIEGTMEMSFGAWMVNAEGHIWSSWITKRASTVFVCGQKQRSCSSCNIVESASIKKLTPMIRLSATSKTIKKKKKFTLSVKGMARGDYVKSFKSSKKKIATVSSKGVVKGKKKGTAYITVTLASGKTARCKVKVK